MVCHGTWNTHKTIKHLLKQAEQDWFKELAEEAETKLKQAMLGMSEEMIAPHKAKVSDIQKRIHRLKRSEALWTDKRNKAKISLQTLKYRSQLNQSKKKLLLRIKHLRDVMKLSQKKNSIHNLTCELDEKRNWNAWLENEVTRLTEVNRYVYAG